MVSIHPRPLSSSSPLPRNLHPKTRCLDWQAKDIPQWKGGGLPPSGAGWDGGRGPTHVSCTWAQNPPWRLGVYFQEPEEALPEDSPAFRVAAAALSVLGDGQLVPGHLTGKGHTIQLPRFPVRWKGPGRV